jgi:hypothetical protein
VVPFISPDEPLAVQDRHFIECIATGSRPLTDGANGLAVVEAVEAAELSRRLGRPVLLAELSSAGRFTQPFSLSRSQYVPASRAASGTAAATMAASAVRTGPEIS